MVRRVLSVALACVFVAACAAESSQQKSVTPANGGGEEHPAEWFQIGAARDDLKNSEAQMDASMSDCESACKALASLERAVNHICAVADTEECTDARLRAQKARQAVNSKCGSC